jgi:NAD(P)-dependent dehydrogenase (short-subunit alcohol dehydrogenase family)
MMNGSPAIRVDLTGIDLTDFGWIKAAAGALDLQLDALCNVAGVPSTADKNTVLKVNFFGLRHFTEVAIDHFVDGASIVNVAWLAGFRWRSNMEVVKGGMVTDLSDADNWIAAQLIDGAASYHLSKELVIAWTIWNCQRWKGRGICMNCVSPGPVDTPILRDFIKTLSKCAEDDLQINRAATPREIAPVIALMCDDVSMWMNCSDVAVEAGAGAWQQLLS